MAKKHGLSHAIATLISIIASGFLVRVLFIQFPALYNGIINFCNLLKDRIPVPLTSESIAVMLLASFFAFLWGLMFFYINKEHHLLSNRDVIDL